MTDLEMVGMLKEMQKETANTKGFFIGHVTHAWVINDLLGSKIAELEGEDSPDVRQVKTEEVCDGNPANRMNSSGLMESN